MVFRSFIYFSPLGVARRFAMDGASGSGSAGPPPPQNGFLAPGAKAKKRKQPHKADGGAGDAVAETSEPQPTTLHLVIQNEALAIARDRIVIVKDEETGRKKLLDIFRLLKSEDFVRVPCASEWGLCF